MNSLEVPAAAGASAAGATNAAAASAGGLGRFDAATRFGAVGKAVSLPCETELAGNISVRPRLHIHAFHLPLENGTYEKRDDTPAAHEMTIAGTGLRRTGCPSAASARYSPHAER